MRTMLNGFTGWVQMREPLSESVRNVDKAITVVGTLLIFTTWMILH